MKLSLELLAILAFLGAFDTLYYHEWRAKLPLLGLRAAPELRLHAFRDFVYAILFVSLPWLAWQGWYVVVLCALFIIEIVLTLWDFIMEYWVRKELGGLYPGESVMHGVMGIVYGAMLSNIVPVLRVWWRKPAGLVFADSPVSGTLRWVMVTMAVGVFLSGIRDLCTAAALPGSAWPWVVEDKS